MLDKAVRQTEIRKKSGASSSLDIQVALLCEAFGMMKYAPAKELLKRYIPKDFVMGSGPAVRRFGHLGICMPISPMKGWRSCCSSDLRNPASCLANGIPCET